MLKKIIFSGILLSSLVSAYALTPTLTASNSGSGDYVLLSTTGDPNSSVVLYYYSSLAPGLQSKTIGTTGSNGSFWTTLSTSAYGVSSNASVYITINGVQSSQVSWPYVTATSTTGTALSLSQTGVALMLGQSTTLSATNASSLYLFNNTNPSVANISISGGQLTVTANSYGSTIFTVCSGNSSNCVSVYVIVQNGTAPALTFSQSNLTIATGQSLPVSVYGGSGVYTIVNNSNNGAISASLNGTTINLQANSGSGQATITVCTSDMMSCGIVNVTIGTTTSLPLTFSQTNPTLSVGQSMTVSLSGSSGGYYVSSNSNGGVVQATVSGNTLTLYGSSYGSASVLVCSSSASCGSLFVTVSGAGSGGNISLGQTSLVLVTGQVVSITVSGGSMPYNTFTTLNGIVSTSLSNNLLTVTGGTAGTTTINVCSSGGGCAVLSVVVNASTGGQYVNTTPGFSQNTISLSSGQTSNISISGTGGYYLGNNSNPSVATGVVTGSTITITAGVTGQAALSVCQTTSQCNVITVTVNGAQTNTTTNTISLSPQVAVGQYAALSIVGTGGPYSISSPSSPYYYAAISGSVLTLKGLSSGIAPLTVCTSNSNTCTTLTITVGEGTYTSPQGSSNTTSSLPVTTTGKYRFDNPLKLGAKGQEVIELQKRLHEEGYFNGTYSVNFGDATVTAVKKYQKAKKLPQLGNLGPATRAALNR